MTDTKKEIVIEGEGNGWSYNEYYAIGFVEEDVTKLSPEDLERIFKWLRDRCEIVVVRDVSGHGAVCTSPDNPWFEIREAILKENETEAEFVAAFNKEEEERNARDKAECIAKYYKAEAAEAAGEGEEIKQPTSSFEDEMEVFMSLAQR